MTPDPVILAALVVVGSSVLVVLAYRWLGVRYRVPFAPTEVLEATTGDGWRLPVYRHRRPFPPEARRGAVVCLHGLGASHFNFDLPGTGDLAGYLAERGFDVYVASFRGDHDTVPPPHGSAGFSFDDHVDKDLVAIIDAVLRRSEERSVHLVGHSMGGLVAYAWVGTHGEEHVRSVTTMGSPVGFHEKARVVGDLGWLEAILGVLRTVHIRAVARLAAPFIGRGVPRAFLKTQFNPRGVDYRLIRRAAWHSLSHVSVRLLSQFADWLRHDAFRSVGHDVDYRERLAQLTVPLFVLLGTVDFMCRPIDGTRAVELASSKDKTRLVLGTESGCRDEYGHIDMVFGLRAREEVFAPIVTFLERVEGAARPVDPKRNGHDPLVTVPESA